MSEQKNYDIYNIKAPMKLYNPKKMKDTILGPWDHDKDHTSNQDFCILPQSRFQSLDLNKRLSSQSNLLKKSEVSEKFKFRKQNVCFRYANKLSISLQCQNSFCKSKSFHKRLKTDNIIKSCKNSYDLKLGKIMINNYNKANKINPPKNRQILYKDLNFMSRRKSDRIKMDQLSTEKIKLPKISNKF